MVRFSDFITLKDKNKFGIMSRETTSGAKMGLQSYSQFSETSPDNHLANATGRKPPPEPSATEDSTLRYEKFVERAVYICKRVKNNQEIHPSPILSDLRYIIDKHLEEEMYKHAKIAASYDEPLIFHCVQVTLLSLMVARVMNYNLRSLLMVGLAAFLENVGMYKIEEGILLKKGELDEEERAIIREHPKTSYEILSQIGKGYHWVAEIAFQVHERSDGSGYPQGLRGNEISELSSIIGMIDAYVAMTSDRLYRGRFQDTDAVKFLIGKGENLFPAKIRKAFVGKISPFPMDTNGRQKNQTMLHTNAQGIIDFVNPSLLIGKNLEYYGEPCEEGPIEREKEPPTGKIKKKIVRWEASVTADVSNYRLYWSESGEVNYDSDHFDLGNVTQIILPDDVPLFPLDSGEISVGVSAVNAAGNESGIAQLATRLNFGVPVAPKNLVAEDL